MTQKQHVIHGRDHEHTGPDPIQIHWEDVGGGGSGGGGGIQFDTYPQAGEWLYVETDGPGESPSGYGIELFDQGGQGVSIASAGGDVDINSSGGGWTYLRSNNRVYIYDHNAVDGGGITIQSEHSEIWITSFLKTHITSSTDNVIITAGGTGKQVVLNSLNSWIYVTGGGPTVGGITLTVGVSSGPYSTAEQISLGGNVRITLAGPTGGTDSRFQIRDDGGHPLLEVRADGTFHIKTGASWAADL